MKQQKEAKLPVCMLSSSGWCQSHYRLSIALWVMGICASVSLFIWTTLFWKPLSIVAVTSLGQHSPSGLSMSTIDLGTNMFSMPHFGFWSVIYIAAIILPLILGMAGKIGFRWVILWESIMFLPVGIFIVLLIGTTFFWKKI